MVSKEPYFTGLKIPQNATQRGYPLEGTFSQNSPCFRGKIVRGFLA